jgi:hypothetical protein
MASTASIAPVTDANSKNKEENTAKAKCEYRQKERVIDVNVFWELFVCLLFQIDIVKSIYFKTNLRKSAKSACFYFHADLADLRRKNYILLNLT